VATHWRDKDEGIWEVRGGKQHFTYSKVRAQRSPALCVTLSDEDVCVHVCDQIMSWVAMDRAIRLAEQRSFPADIHRWRGVRDEIFMEVMEKAWNKDRQAFVQHYSTIVHSRARLRRLSVWSVTSLLLALTAD
jgi:GH15 family glucan-1,4-alpha-glucosidase